MLEQQMAAGNLKSVDAAATDTGRRMQTLAGFYKLALVANDIPESFILCLIGRE